MKRLAIITGILSGFLFGVATPFSKFLLTGLNSFQLAGLLYLGAALAMMPYVVRKGNEVKLLFNRESRIKTAGIIFFGGFLGPVLLLAGLKSANAASVSIWLNMELVATAILGVLLFKDTLDRYAWIGVVLTLCAGLITSVGEGMGGILPGLIITAACFCWGADNHLTALVDGVSSQTVTFVKGIIAGTVNLLLGIFISNGSVELLIIAIALAVGVFSYGFSIMLYVTSAQNIGATRAQIMFSTAPVWGVLLAYIFFGNPFQWVHVISVCFLAGAIIITNLFSHKHVHTHKALTHIHYHRHNDGHHTHSHGEDNTRLAGWHSHYHTHNAITHDHPHDPDLHHRHEHK
jgi:drug/metabolite transporter (DMT)-like permease